MNAAVIFDMDGVLIDSGPAHLRSWQSLARQEDLTITTEQFAESFGRPSREIIRLYFGHDLGAEQVRRLDDRKEELYRDLVRDRIPVMPGATSLLGELLDRGIAMALGTSGPPANVDLVLNGRKWRKYFSAVVTGMDVSRGKPDPQVFQLAAEKLGVLPQACVVVEDAPAGIEAAHRAGMKAIALASTHPREALSSADRVVGHLSELTAESLVAMVETP